MTKLRVLDLFSGIGGFSLGLERTGGFETVAFCEIEKYPQKVLKKHWPDVPIYEDVRNVTAKQLDSDGIRPDIITGGFPCQDISVAGKQAGINAERSGLWSECARILGEIRPRYAIFENVTALLSGDRGRWFQQVLWDISKVGYDAEWHCIPASELGAYHHRDRVWIIAYPRHKKQGQQEGNVRPISKKHVGQITCDLCENMADTTSTRQQRQRELEQSMCAEAIRKWKAIDAESGCITGIWATEPDVGRVAYGIPGRMDRLKGLGNAVVPQIPELIGYAILDCE